MPESNLTSPGAYLGMIQQNIFYYSITTTLPHPKLLIRNQVR